MSSFGITMTTTLNGSNLWERRFILVASFQSLSQWGRKDRQPSWQQWGVGGGCRLFTQQQSRMHRSPEQWPSYDRQSPVPSDLLPARSLKKIPQPLKIAPSGEISTQNMVCGRCSWFKPNSSEGRHRLWGRRQTTPVGKHWIRDASRQPLACDHAVAMPSVLRLMIATNLPETWHGH